MTKEYTVKVYDSGTKHWHLNDKLHREDGPAIEWANGFKEWYLNDEFLTKKQWLTQIKSKCKTSAN